MGIYAFDEQTLNAMPALGRTFLSAAYMMVDDDKHQFTLWKGQPSTEQKLIASGPPTCTTSVAASPSVTLSSPPSATSSNAPPTGLSKGVVSGISVSAVVMISACFAVGYFLARKRSRRHQGPQRENTSKHSSLGSEQPLHFKPELSSDQQPPQEMSLGRHMGDAIPPYEMNGQSHATEMLGSGHEDYAIELPGSRVDCPELQGSRRNRGSMKTLPATPRPKKAPPVPMRPSPTSPKRKPLPGRAGDGRAGDGRAQVLPRQVPDTEEGVPF